MPSLSGVRVAVLMLGLAAASAFAAESGTPLGPAPGGEPAPVEIAQVPREGGGRMGSMSDAERAKMRQQMMDRMLQQSGLTDKEKAAARKTIQSKDKARQALASELTKLRRVANQSKPSDRDLRAALAAYRAALAKYRSKIAAEDAALVKQLSVKSQVRCMSLGILDNGLGMMGPGGPGERGSRGAGPGPSR